MRKVDVVVLTAITLEYEAARQVAEGAVEGEWEEVVGPNGLPVAFRSFRRQEGRPLRVALVLAGDMGAVAATNALLPLVEACEPVCVAMCGVCAGRPGKTGLGDVVAAERLFFHDTGKRLPDGVQQDLKTFNLRDDWKVALRDFDFAKLFREQEWWKKRPIPYEWQQNWALAKLRGSLGLCLRVHAQDTGAGDGGCSPGADSARPAGQEARCAGDEGLNHRTWKAVMTLRLSKEMMYVTLSKDEPFAEWYVTKFMPAHVPEFAYSISEEGKREMVLQGRRYAERFGIHDVPSQYHFITLMWKVGPNFFEFPGFREPLMNPKLTGPEKINRLYETPSEQAVEAITRADDRYWYPYMLTVHRP